jgi:hypothetical protein
LWQGVLGALTLSLALAGNVEASLAGPYEAFLDGDVTDGAFEFGIEGHDAIVTFDGTTEALPNTFNSNDNLTGNDLWITEMQTGNHVSIWVFGGDGTSTPPELGSYGPLFNNPLETSGAGIVTFDLEGLSDSNLSFPGGTIENLLVTATFDGGNSSGDVSVDLLNIFGDGTQLNPFDIFMDLNSADLVAATDLHLDFDIQAVPVPAAVWLFGSGLVGLVGVARRRRM